MLDKEKMCVKHSEGMLDKETMCQTQRQYVGQIYNVSDTDTVCWTNRQCVIQSTVGIEPIDNVSNTKTVYSTPEKLWSVSDGQNIKFGKWKTVTCHSTK